MDVLCCGVVGAWVGFWVEVSWEGGWVLGWHFGRVDLGVRYNWVEEMLFQLWLELALELELGCSVPPRCLSAAGTG